MSLNISRKVCLGKRISLIMLHTWHVTHEHFIDLKQIFMTSQNFQNGVTNQLFLQKEITGLKFKLIAWERP